MLQVYGEERFAGRIVNAIIKERETKPIETTLELSELIKAAYPAKERFKEKHPARKSFQAIRLEVNHEPVSYTHLDVYKRQGLKCVLTKTSLPCVMLKLGDVNTLPKIVRLIHQYGRKAVVHQDSIKGLARDRTSIDFLSKLGVDAVITMKPQCVRWIKEEEMLSILGLFLIDTNAMATGVQSINESRPDAGLVMPMTLSLIHIFAGMQEPIREKQVKVTAEELVEIA